MDKLEPVKCPLCGKTPMVCGWRKAYCVKCIGAVEGYLHEVTIYAKTEEEAIRRWNRVVGKERDA